MGKIILRLDRMMVERKMSLNELAERVGISNVNLSKIKNNKVTAIRFSTLAAICEALNCAAVAASPMPFAALLMVSLIFSSFFILNTSSIIHLANFARTKYRLMHLQDIPPPLFCQRLSDFFS